MTETTLANHLRQAHGWTVFDAEETDLYALRAMHRVAYETGPQHGCEGMS